MEYKENLRRLEKPGWSCNTYLPITVALSGPGKGKTQLGVTLDARRAAYVILRAKAGEYSASKMTGMIVRWWMDKGAPAVIEGEAGASKLAWEANVKWETLLDMDELPPKADLPRDHPALARFAR
jgi:hypothetical protein